MADLSIGVIGAGGMGLRHVHNVQRYVKGAHVAAICDLDQARRSTLQKRVAVCWPSQTRCN